MYSTWAGLRYHTSVGSSDGETGTKSGERVRRQALRRHVGELLVRWHMNNTQLAKRHVFLDEVDVQLDVLRSSMVDGVLAHVDG